MMQTRVYYYYFTERVSLFVWLLFQITLCIKHEAVIVFFFFFVITTMNFRKKSTKRNSILPHLPKAETMPNAQISEPPMMPGQKTLPSADWKNDGHGQQLVRTGKQGVPWTDRQSKVQLDSDLEPPPVFTATPSRGLTLRQPTKSQRHVFRMESGIDPVVLLTTRLETWRTALKNLVISKIIIIIKF